MMANERVVTINEKVERTISSQKLSRDVALVRLGDREVRVELGVRVGAMQMARIDGKPVAFAWDRDDAGLRLTVAGAVYSVTLVDAMTKRLRDRKQAAGGASDWKVKVPMPGTVLAVRVEVGDVVEKGQVLCILEAMKMQNEIRAEQAGVVKALAVQAGKSVARNDLLFLVGVASEPRSSRA